MLKDYFMQETNESEILFKCDVCQHAVTLRTGVDRTTWDNLLIPSDMPIATCSFCGEQYLTSTERDHLIAINKLYVTECDGKKFFNINENEIIYNFLNLLIKHNLHTEIEFGNLISCELLPNKKIIKIDAESHNTREFSFEHLNNAVRYLYKLIGN